jgi:hypothetical protein
MTENNLQPGMSVEQAMAAAATPAPVASVVAEAIRAFGVALDEGVTRLYREAGSPYGDTSEGVTRWWHEQDESK